MVRKSQRSTSLTPFESPNGDAVLLRVATTDTDQIVVSDAGSAADAIGYGHQTEADRSDRERVQARFGVTYAANTFRAAGSSETSGDLCLRVVQASATYAAMRAGKGSGRRASALRRRVSAELNRARVTVREDVKITGLSGHAYQIELFVPQGENVLALLPQSDFAAAQRAHSRLADIKQANGYRAVSILDDFSDHPSPGRRKISEGERLLGQVGEVVLASRLDGWISRLAA